MSISKLESLPNEILIDTFEKYVNGVDILVAFDKQLNNRFDALIAQCQQFHFDFTGCRKDDFRFCMDLLPVYLDKIGGLALSEQDTPGQIHTFFSFFPSFASFKRLRSLDFLCNWETVDRNQVQSALLSLSNSTVEVLWIKGMNATDLFSSNNTISSLFRLTSLKRFSLLFSPDYSHWKLLTSTQSNIEHLTITGLHCDWKKLQLIFQCASRLKYLNVGMTDFSNYHYNWGSAIAETKINLTQMPTLRTFILDIFDNDETSLDMLTQYLNATPFLHRLEMTARITLFNSVEWEMLLDTSLPHLTYFSLQTNISRLEHLGDAELQRVLTSFQTPFWNAKEHFHIIITEHESLGFAGKDVNVVRNLGERGFRMNHISILHMPVIECWTAHLRTTSDNAHMPDSITNLCLSSISSFPSHQYYFGNIKFLAVDNLDRTLLEWITTYVKCSRVTELAISLLDEEPNMITSLLEYFTNITSLQIDFNQLIAHQTVRIRRNSHLKTLDISGKEHRFSEEDILTIAQVFQRLEHLIINTADLYNIPLLNTHFPHLHTLTLRIVPRYFNRMNNFEQGVWNDLTRCETHFWLQRESNWITIWIDQAALEKSFWHTFANEAVSAPVTNQVSK